MSIARLKKVTLCGLLGDQQAMLDGLQGMGLMHLIPLSGTAAVIEIDDEASYDDAYKALRWITDVAQRRHQVRDDSQFDLDRVVRDALRNQQQLREAEDRKAFLQQRINELLPWGSFSLPRDIADLGGYRLWFYQVPLGKLELLAATDYCYQEVHRDNRFAFVVVIARDEPDQARLPLPRTHAGSWSLADLRGQLERVGIELDDLQDQHRALSKWIYLLSGHLAAVEDRRSLHRARQEMRQDDHVCLIQGWVPEQRLPELRRFCLKLRLVCMEAEPADDERPPTLLSNAGAAQAGEDLVNFYQTPGYRSWDPSRLVFFSFALFFAMILADAGYAMLLALPLLLYWRRLGRTATLCRVRFLASVLIATSLSYGVLTGSYFGIAPPADGLLARLAWIDLNDFDSMMRLSIGIGCLHLLLANGLRAWQSGPFPDNAAPLGWMLAVGGGYLGWLRWLDGASGWPGWLMLTTGLLLVLLFASRRPARDWRGWSWRLLDGLMELTRVTAAFGDVLSYLRLFALGLASASLAVTFNQLAVQVKTSLPGTGLFLALLILLVGHLINLALGVISGFVHGLRLNFIEFFKWGLSEEGYPFRPFRAGARGIDRSDRGCDG